MSYLTLDPGVEDFTQAVIAFWFRVPSASIQTAMGSFSGQTHSAGFYTDASPPATLLDGVVPLVTFGRPQETTLWTAPVEPVGSYSYTLMRWHPTDISTGAGFWEVDVKQTDTVTAQRISGLGTYPLDPCFIGIECIPANSLPDGNPPVDSVVLKVNLQMDRADPSTFTNTIVSGGGVSDWVDYGYGYAPGYNFWPQSHNNYAAIIADGQAQPIFNPDSITAIWDSLPKSTVDLTQTVSQIPDNLRWPETFVLGGVEAAGDVPKLTVTPDDWHQVIISLDLSKPVSTQGLNWDAPPDSSTPAHGTISAAQAWIALDRENITKDDLSQYWPKGVFGGPGYADPNAILTRYAYEITTSIHQPGEIDFYNVFGTWLRHHTPTPFPKFSYQSNGVPSAAAPFGIPSSADHENSIYRIETAEFHMWTGVTLDTSVADNIALFIKDDGRPNTHYAQTGDKDAQGMDDVLGTPVLRLHGSGDWVNGKNTGSLGLDASQTPPEVLSDGQFTVTAKINPYKPDPSLGGQASAQSAKPEIRLKKRIKA